MERKVLTLRDGRSDMLMLMNLDHESVIQVTNYRIMLGYLGTYHTQDGILPILEIIYYYQVIIMYICSTSLYQK